MLELGKDEEKALVVAVEGVVFPLSYSLCSLGDPEPIGSG
jgi:hypothetical protein